MSQPLPQPQDDFRNDDMYDLMPPMVVPSSAWAVDRESDQIFQQAGGNIADCLRQGQVCRAIFAKTGDEGALLEGLGYFRQALVYDPRNATAYALLGITLWQHGDIDPIEAEQYCRTALSIDSECAMAHFYLGYLLSHRHRYEQAAQAYARAKALLPWPHAKASLGLAWIHVANPQVKQLSFFRWLWAGVELAASILLLPFDREPMPMMKGRWTDGVLKASVNSLARCLEVIGFRGAASRLYHWALNHCTHKGDLYQKLANLYALDEPANSVYGVLTTQAPITIDHPWQDEDPIDTMPSFSVADSVADEIINTIMDGREGDDDTPVAPLAPLSDELPDDFEAIYRRAQRHLESKEYMRSLYYFKEAEKRAPSHPYIHSNMAYVLFKLDDHEGAIFEYETALQYGDDPQWLSTVAQTLGTLHYKSRGDLASALSVFKMALEWDPDNLQIQTTLVDLYTETGDLLSAVEIYSHIVEAYPDNADCLTYLGFLLWQLDRNDEAVAAYEKAIHCDVANAIAYNNLGVIYLDDFSQPEEALALFQKACDLNDDYTMAVFNLARANEALGVRMTAAELYQQALALNADHPELVADEIESRLQRLFDVD